MNEGQFNAIVELLTRIAETMERAEKQGRSPTLEEKLSDPHFTTALTIASPTTQTLKRRKVRS